MPTIRVNGVELYYEDTEKGDEIIVFSHGLLFSCRMFDDQVNYFKSRYRCIAYDHRGHGQSEIAKDGYDMETIYADGVALIDAPFQVRSATGQHRRHGGVSGGGKGRGQGL